MQNDESKEALKQTLLTLADPHELEAFGKTLSVSDLLLIFSIARENKETIADKVSAILEGVTHEVFFQVIPQLVEEDLLLLQHESKTIPVQQHLSVLSTEKAKELEMIEMLFLSLEMIISQVDIEKLEVSDLNNLLNKIDELSHIIGDKIDLLNRALRLAWNSERIDLIDHLSALKEALQKFQTVYIGSPELRIESTIVPATALYATLNNRLSSVYDDANIAGNPAIEAIAKLGVWSSEDYFEMGLLPEIESAEFLDLDASTHNEIDRLQYKENLMETAKAALAAKGLRTIEDLKKNKIYSKKALKEYLKL